ncbi:hypothetical protein N0V94_003059 [Neodidymelliopsis sp. IMI 364377]|nr:hypothetical protein N0V94_003059 [Neodidymelliopsis sp. IMI 364377]
MTEPEWNTFEDEVLTFWDDERTKRKLQRCDDIPVGPDPEINLVNPNAMTTERIQCGGEITLSGRFFQNALAPVISCVETMSSPDHGPDDEPDYLPSKLTFGDAWIRGIADSVVGQQPDVITKLHINGEDEVRLVGELKFCGTVKLGRMGAAQMERMETKFKAILGQLVHYMRGHRLQFAFFSTYQDTIFLRLSHTFDSKQNKIPRLYFSRVIKDKDVVDETNRKISVRLALFYLIHKTFSGNEPEWRIPQDILNLTETWITKSAPVIGPAVTPYGNPINKVNIHTDDVSSEDEHDPSKQGNPFEAPYGRSTAARRQVAFQQDQQNDDQAFTTQSPILTPSRPPKTSGQPDHAAKGTHHLVSLPDSPLPADNPPKPWSGSFTDRLRSQGHEEAAEDTTVAAMKELTVNDPQIASSSQVRGNKDDESQS